MDRFYLSLRFAAICVTKRNERDPHVSRGAIFKSHRPIFVSFPEVHIRFIVFGILALVSKRFRTNKAKTQNEKNFEKEGVINIILT